MITMDTACAGATQVLVDLKALCHNYRLLQERAGGEAALMAMVKADGYGHGMIECARALAAVGCRHFAVAELAEGVALRRAGVQGLILVQFGCPDQEAAGQFLVHDLTPVVTDLATIQTLSQVATDAGRTLAVHLKVDSGMGRLGVLPEEAADYVQAIQDAPGLRLTGVMSHFPRADEADAEQTREQDARFTRLCDALGEPLADLAHIANSGGLLYWSKSCRSLARPGIALYGYYPDGAGGRAREQGETLQPVMSVQTRLLQVKEVATGVGISYGHAFVTSRPTRLGVLPIGYANGYLRGLVGKAEVLVRGRRVPVIGRICMNLCMVDLTDCGHDLAVGEPVVVLGQQGEGEITADEIASWLGTISYEVLCLLGNNNQRQFL